MISPDSPPDEVERLDELLRLQILDTPAEERFDRLARLATALLKTPIALVSLVDANRQWFKSCIGLDVRETDRSVSFCGHALHSDTPLVVNDALLDHRFRDNPLVSGHPHIRFYAGRPIHGPRGYRVGTLCVIDDKPRELTPVELTALDDLAALVESELRASELSQAVEAQTRSEKRLRAIMRSVGDVVLVFNGDGVIQATNPAAERVFGTGADGLIGRNVFSLVAEEDRSQALDKMAVRRGGVVQEVRLSVSTLRDDGSRFPLEVVVNDLEGEEDLTFIATGRDMTPQHTAAAAVASAQRQLRTILDSVAEGVLGVDTAGRATFVNPAAERLFGYSSDALLGQRIHEIVHGRHADGRPYPGEACPTCLTLTSGQVSLESNEVFWRSDGTSFPAEYRSAPIIEDGVITGAVVTFSDITERREVERLKDEFVSVVSHELRTPLTSIRGSLGLLVSGALGELPERGAQMLDIAVSNTDRLVRLVNDVLDLERIASGRAVMDIRDTPAPAILQSAVEAIRGAAERSPVALSLECADVDVRADSDRIVQVLVNLLGNAIKFSSEGDTVWLRGAEDDGCFHIQVTDQGRGIPPEALDRIFDRFEQVDASDSRQKGGTGLGLAIARSIVELHGGSIWAESQPGVGTTFHVQLQLSARHSEEESAGSNGRALVVEDDLDLAHVIAGLLEQADLHVDRARDEGEALAALREGLPDVVVLDVELREGDAYAVLAALRMEPGGNSVPVVVYTVHDLDGPQREALQLGPVTILTKSRVTPEELREEVVKMLGQGH